MMRATEFQELVDATITLEDDFKQLQEEKRKKAKFEPKRFVSNKPNTSLSFKPRYNNNNNNNNNSNYYNSRRNQAFQTANQAVCRSCGLTGHFAKDCKKPRIICFGCRQEGHMLKDCPKRNTGGGQSGGGGSRGVLLAFALPPLSVRRRSFKLRRPANSRRASAGFVCGNLRQHLPAPASFALLRKLLRLAVDGGRWRPQASPSPAKVFLSDRAAQGW
ncbi:hypothetical protein QYE76_037839 [Lolium multiflorum]|uniref:CCHC-type domain-containing protein n=1 Tax=Lolium multiflorum TaxID=4521 RepID=A0AAD8T8F3_LOLMU|nr:hypothetical protein QYE76_037839 [Lolium multiflorum]